MSFNPAEEQESWIARVRENESTDPTRYLLSHPGDVIVAEQLHCYPRARQKFPNWHRDGMAYTRLAMEQSSGETAARFKANLISGQTLADLTGGLGMDTLAFSDRFKTVHYVDPAQQPYLLARHNHTILEKNGIQHHLMTAEQALDILPDVDWIYIDPSRRNPAQRVFRLQECEPDLTLLWDRLRTKAGGVMVKLSPMTDLQAVIRALSGIFRIYVISVDGEVKEVLALAAAQTQVSGPVITAVCLPENLMIDVEPAEIPVISLEMLKGRLTESGSRVAVHVPDPALLKTRATNAFAREHGLQRLHHETDYLIGAARFIAGARSYPIRSTEEFKPKALRKEWKGKKVHLHQRGFPLSTQELYNRLAVQMGEDAHLFFTKASEGKLIVLTTDAALRSEA